MTDQPHPVVVLADDDESTRRLLAAQLRRQGYPIAECENGAQAFERIRELTSCIVIADWMMPEMDGLALCRAVQELRRMGALGFVYFILLTAQSEKERIVEGFEAGADDYLTKPYHRQELFARLQSGERIFALQRETFIRRLELERKNAELDVLTRRLEKLANTDTLTGLPNRRAIFERLDELWALHTRVGRTFACVMLDVDRFKHINDTFGHAAGDAVLRAIGHRCQKIVRTYDILGRFGGEELLVLCPETGPEAAVALAERIRESVAATPVEFEGTLIQVTVSGGAAVVEEHHTKAEDVVAAADSMLYRAKAGGRNQVWLARGKTDGVQYAPVESAAAALGA